MPACPEPIEECESIAISFSCTFAIPSNYPDATEADECRRFLKKVQRLVFDQSQSEPGYSFSLLEDTKNTETAIYEDGDCHICEDLTFSSEQVTFQDSPPRDETLTVNWSSICGGPCEGEIVFVDGNDSGNNYTSDDVTCAVFTVEVDSLDSRDGDRFFGEFTGGDFTQTYSVEFDEELTPTKADEMLAALDFPDDTTGEDCYSYDNRIDGCPDLMAGIQKARVQFRVPTTHAGTYFKIVFDVIEEPEGWDDVTIFRTFYATDVEREWTGPGTGDQDDPSWLMGSPYNIPQPDIAGVRRIVNRRYYCYPNGTYGYKPQISGEGAEIVTPP
jgi:hypothetical protein